MSDNYYYFSLPVLGAAAWVLMYPDAPFGTTALLGATFGSLSAAVSLLLFREYGPSTYGWKHELKIDEFRKKVESDKHSPEIVAVKEGADSYRIFFGEYYTVGATEADVKGMATYAKVMYIN